MKYWQRTIQYLYEIRTCYRITAGPFEFAALLGRTVEFHISNLLGLSSSDGTRPPEKHRIRLAGKNRDLWLRPRTGDLFIFHEIFTNACYRIPKAILPKANVIMDLGANIGLTTLFLSQLFPDARYVCVEPNPFNADVLRRNVEWLGDRATVIECAISGYCGDTSFADSGWSWGGHIESDRTGDRTVRCLTVGHILQSHGIDFVDLLKVDIEGAENIVFSRDSGWLASVGCVVIEFHGGYGFTQFGQDLSPFGFTTVAEGSPAGNAMTIAVSGRQHG